MNKMSKLKFEGALELISERQFQFISSVLEEKGFGDTKAIIEAVGKPGDNYGANVKRIIAEKDGKVFKMIAKIAPSVEMLRKALNIGAVFNNEFVMYTEVLPKFSKIEKAAGITDDEMLKCATCYGCQMDNMHEVILIEDLQEAGFVMLDRFKSLTNDEIKVVLKDFAKLHALSYALKHQEPDSFSVLRDKLFHMGEILSEVSEMKMFFAQIEDNILSQTENEKYKKAVKGSVSEMAANMMKLYKVDKEARYSVVSHGDAWTNNIMFIKEEGKPLQCCMIDYQQSRINSPAGDLLYMLFNCSDYETRTKHFCEWIEYYHSQLDNCLANYGLKANYLYPRDQLDADLKRHGRVSLGQSILLSSVLLRESADAAKIQAAMQKNVPLEDVMEEFQSVAMDFGVLVQYKTRIEGLIDSHLKLGFI